ncbi:MAG: methyltransferase domain-containing protein [Shimia sp.]
MSASTATHSHDLDPAPVHAPPRLPGALAARVAEAFAAAGGAGPVLDLGASTGAVAAALRRAGIGPTDGLDAAAAPLAAAAARGLYRRTIQADAARPLPVPDGVYGGVVSVGDFAPGRLGPETLTEVLRILAPGGLACLAIDTAHWEAERFAAHLATLLPMTAPRIDRLAPCALGGTNVLLRLSRPA